MTYLWIRQIKNHRIHRQLSIPCGRESPMEALAEGCRQMDLSQPLWLTKHQRDWDDFGMTRFIPQEFMESVDFDRLEIEFIDPDAKKKKSQDPRNQ